MAKKIIHYKKYFNLYSGIRSQITFRLPTIWCTTHLTRGTSWSDKRKYKNLLRKETLFHFSYDRNRQNEITLDIYVLHKIYKWGIEVIDRNERRKIAIFFIKLW